MDISVVLCTHNPRKAHLERTLDALRAQTLPLDRWELIVVDNDSDSRVRVDVTCYPNAMVIDEPRLGLAYARIAGIKKAKGRIIVFVDDDNVLAPDYLETALRIGDEYPMMGTWGSGNIVPEFEVNPPEQISPWLNWLALRTFEKPIWSNVAREYAALPVGAGLCVRSNVAQKHIEQFELGGVTIGDRRGRNDLSGCGDYEISFVACVLGLGMGSWPELKMTHMIPKERLTEDYIVRVVAASRASFSLLEYKWFGTRWRSPLWPHVLYDFLRQISRLKGVERRIEIAFMRARFRVWKTIVLGV